MKNTLFVIFIVVHTVAVYAQAVTRHVPSEYSTIQEAIDSCNNEDEIIVSIGTYYENINFLGKDIILRSTDPLNPIAVSGTTIDGSLGGSVVTFSGTESPDCVLSGFTITNGSGSGSMGDIRGGGVYGNGTLATIQYNIIAGNEASPWIFPGSGFGGGLYDCDGAIQSNIISGNRTLCDEGDAWGGGLCNCDGTIQNNVISSNSASGFSGGWGYIKGGGLWGCDGHIRNNTIFNNSASGSGPPGFIKGGGLCDCSSTIINCIIWQNTADEGAQLYASSTPSYSCIQDWSGGGTGNITDNPELIDPNGGDFHLQSGSPCIDAGAYIPDLTEDFEGDSRPRGYDYDIGADEFISDNVPPDTPTNISPVDGATDVCLTPTLTASAFSDSNVGDIHQASQWHIWVTDSPPDDPITVFALTKTSGDLVSVVILSRTLSDNISYSWSVRYQDNQGAWSSWSDPTEFTTEQTGEVITVPGDYPTIQTAIASAIIGDQIVVSTGTYYENISFGGKDIILRSTEPTNPSIVANTIIDGNQAGSVVIFSGTEPASCVLSGFTIINGTGSSLTLDGATTEPPYGGGIFGNCTLSTIQNNVITNNSANSGAGVAGCHGTIQNNTICDNSAEGAHGGYGGGLYLCDGMIQDNSITGNSATGGSGGLFDCDGTIQRNRISNNSAQTNGGGLSGCGNLIQNNIITGNSTESHGGGLNQCHSIIRNNLICGNSAQKWGGGFYYCSGAILQNNTICGNSGSRGGGVSRGGTIQNCIIWANTATSAGSQVYNVGSITYSCVQGGGGGTNINADPLFVNADNPDPNLRDYHLRPGSPCIDTGDNTAVPPSVTTDLDGRSRFADGDCNDVNTVDMGAYEFAWVYVGDFAGGCDVDFKDFGVLALAWLTEDGEGQYNPVCDINLPADSFIDEKDLAVFVDNWLEGIE